MIIVTRHKSLIDFLELKGIINKENCRVLTHVSEEDVKDQVVIGNLPLYLASFCKRYYELSFDIPFEKRGNDLTITELQEYYKSINYYKIEKHEINHLPIED